MKFTILSLIFLSSTFIVSGQVTFQKIINANSNDLEYSKSVSFCNDGNYLIGGTLGGIIGGVRRPYLIKMDINGDTLWTRCYAGSFIEDLYSCGQTTDGGYFIAGTIYTFGSGNSGYDFLLLKTDSIGTIQWSKKY